MSDHMKGHKALVKAYIDQSIPLHVMLMEVF